MCPQLPKWPCLGKKIGIYPFLVGSFSLLDRAMFWRVFVLS